VTGALLLEVEKSIFYRLFALLGWSTKDIYFSDGVQSWPVLGCCLCIYWIIYSNIFVIESACLCFGHCV